jgi:hypothetical protein
MDERERLGFEFSTGFEGYQEVAFNLPVESLANLRLWLELHGVRPNPPAQSLLIETLLFLLASGRFDDAVRFHFKEFAEVDPEVRIPEDYRERFPQ